MRTLSSILIVCAFAVLAGCSKSDKEHVFVEEVEQIDASPEEPPHSHGDSHDPGMTMNGKQMPPGHPPMGKMPKGHPQVKSGGMPMGHPQVNSDNIPQYSWELPEGWSQSIPPSSKMRIADIIVPSEKIERCAVYRLASIAALNPFIQMWRSELGLSEIDQSQVKAFLDKQKRFKTQAGYEAIVIELKPESDIDGLAIVNILIKMPQESLSLKLTGKKEAVLDYRDELEKIADSVRIVSQDKQ